MENNKSPGSDGITAEFYKIFWHDVKPYHIKSINNSFLNDHLTTLQKQNILPLIPKYGKDLTQLPNGRPLSLLNIDYKIATKAISNRMNTIIPSIIHSSQTGFISGRYIGKISVLRMNVFNA